MHVEGSLDHSPFGHICSGYVTIYQWKERAQIQKNLNFSLKFTKSLSLKRELNRIS